MDSEKYFVFFSTCIVVNGVNRSLILDLQRENFVSIPNTMSDIIELFNSKKSISEIIRIYGLNNLKVINEYIDFLTGNEYGFLTDYNEFDKFPPMNKTFEVASIITNSIIELSDITLKYLPKIVQDLDDLNCKDVQFISYKTIELKDFKYLLRATDKGNFKSIQLFFKYSDEIFHFVSRINDYNQRITEVTFHSISDTKQKIQLKNFEVNFTNLVVKNFNFCGIIHSKYFNEVNKEKVLESINHNSCLHKKLSINEKGEMQNCPAMIESFGNIAYMNLKEVLKVIRFKEFWDIKKNEINICKVCEFRHVCTDCRAFLETPSDKYSKPLKCGYDPYNNTWEEWSSNPLKEKAILFYGLNDFS